MDTKLQEYFRRLDSGVDIVRQITQEFSNAMGLTGFAYVRIYNDGRVGWLTSDSDHDRLLVDSGFLEKDPLLETARVLKEGCYLWFHDREFPGAQNFYRDRKKHFQIDHGMALINHEKDYLESFCFDGCLAKQPLYNLFVNETGVFEAYRDYFKQQIPKSLFNLFEEGFLLKDVKNTKEPTVEISLSDPKRCAIIEACGWVNLLQLSKREKECLVLLKKGHTYQQIGHKMHLSARTVEHYIESIKNKLNANSRAELCKAAEKMEQFGLDKL